LFILKLLDNNLEKNLPLYEDNIYCQLIVSSFIDGLNSFLFIFYKI